MTEDNYYQSLQEANRDIYWSYTNNLGLIGMHITPSIYIQVYIRLVQRPPSFLIRQPSCTDILNVRVKFASVTLLKIKLYNKL